MKKRALTFGDTQITIAELNTAQVRELIEFGKTEHTPADWESRKWRTIMLSVNNARQAPTKEAPLGTDDGGEDLQATLGFASSSELHMAVLELSALKGEAVAGAAAQ